MIKKLLIAFAAASLVAACSSEPPPPPPAQPQPAQATSFMVFFDWDRYNLSPQAESTIGQAAAAFKQTGAARVVATGHADRSGPENYNMALSLRRANAVKDSLVRNGVPAGAIQVIGKGETQPLVPTADGVREPQNRRVEIVIGEGQAAVPAVFADPRSYCKALSDKWRQYRNAQVDTVEAAAIAKCEAGNYAEGIPVLEDAHIKAKIPLPAPGYRWPGRPYTPA
ncbi:MAG: OmpA family protein [Reyranella sp.]|nr:OmpA family protein [Reyranella sp.]